MTKSAQFSYILKIFCSSLEILEKNKIQKGHLKNDLKNVKFKILHNINKKSGKNADISNINQRDILKILYLSNFEETFQPNSLNRASFNLIHLLKKNINKFTEDIWPDNQIFRDIYNQTLSISILYTIYKIKNLDEH